MVHTVAYIQNQHFFLVTNINFPSSCAQIGKNPKASRGEKEKNKMISGRMNGRKCPNTEPEEIDVLSNRCWIIE